MREGEEESDAGNVSAYLIVRLRTFSTGMYDFRTAIATAWGAVELQECQR